MPQQPDPTRRLEVLTASRRRRSRMPAQADLLAGPALSGSADPALPVTGGWVPDWWATPAADVAEPAEVGEAAEVAEVDESVEPVSGRLPGPPRSQRWNRWRDRWVPESLRDVRLDPGRRGSMVLSLVAAVAAVIAAIGAWFPGSAGGDITPSVTTVVGAQVLATESAAATDTAELSRPSAEPAELVVSVTGAVRRPGVVRLLPGSRVADAIDAAGGIEDGVDYTGLNLAARLTDGDSVVVGGSAQGVHGDAGSARDASDSGALRLVNLNTADQATLETLPGVGPVMAANIIGWRTTNGPFTAVDQLKEITGIGPSRYATLAPLVTV